MRQANRPGNGWPFFIAIDFESMDKYAMFREDPIYVKFVEEVIKPNTEDSLTLISRWTRGKTCGFREFGSLRMTGTRQPRTVSIRTGLTSDDRTQKMRLGYLYSRYPVISQTFCDAEMLALERRGIELVIGSVYPPLTSLRHEYIARLDAPIHYAPPQEILRILERNAKTARQMAARPRRAARRKYGPGAKAEQRARNALYFAEFFARSGVDHVHVHFANRAAHTAVFLKEISGIPFSVTAHGQDFMKDLGSDDLLREICAAAEFVAAETDYSRDLLRQRCPDSAAKIHQRLQRHRSRTFSGASLLPTVIASRGS